MENVTILEKVNCIFTIIDPPFFSKQPQTREIKEFSKVTLTCSAVGKPVPTISWRHTGAEISSQSRFRELQEQAKNLTSITFELIFINITRNEEGNYSCLAQNSVGQVVSSSAVITVQCKYCS